jgi:hypothetical protein
MPVRYVGQSAQANPYNSTQWNVRLNQVFRGEKDRLYGQYIHLTQTAQIRANIRSIYEIPRAGI